MYLLWKRTKNGNLLLDKEGLRNFIASMLPSGYECIDIGLAPDTDEVFASISLPDIYSAIEMELITAKIEDLFSSTGLSPRLTWGVKNREAAPFLNRLRKKIRPVLAGLLAAGAVALYNLGPSGILRAALSGVIVAGLVYCFLDPDGRRTLKSMKERYWR